jgi:hypothetical protein
MFQNKLFKTRAEYETYCSENKIELHKIGVTRLSKYALENEVEPIGGTVEVLIAPGTHLFDNRDLTSFYFEDENDASEFLKYYKNGSSR